MKRRSIASVTSKSAITPWRSGRSAEMLAGVRPIISCASRADGVHLAGALVDRDDGRLGQHDPAPAHVDDRVRGPEVDGHVADVTQGGEDPAPPAGASARRHAPTLAHSGRARRLGCSSRHEDRRSVRVSARAAVDRAARPASIRAAMPQPSHIYSSTRPPASARVWPFALAALGARRRRGRAARRALSRPAAARTPAARAAARRGRGRPARRAAGRRSPARRRRRRRRVRDVRVVGRDRRLAHARLRLPAARAAHPTRAAPRAPRSSRRRAGRSRAARSACARPRPRSR